MEKNDPLFSKAAYRLRCAKKDLVEARVANHQCSADFCNPQSEMSLIAAGHLQGPPLTCNVYLCTFGVFHVCTETACDVYTWSDTRTCHISGLQLGHAAESSYDKNDPRTWRSKPMSTPGVAHLRTPIGAPPLVVAPALPPRRQRVIPEGEIKYRASAMVKLLLFSPNRIARNREAIQQFAEEAHDAKVTYIRQQAENMQLPFLTDLHRLQGHYTKRRLPLAEFTFVEGLHDYYVNIICQIWAKVIAYYVPEDEKEYEEDGVTEVSPRFDFENVCLGVLYAMRQGLRIGTLMLLPKDDFLLANLPIINELGHFKIRRNRITKGDKILTQTYENAIASQVAVHDLMIDVNALPEKREEQVVNNVKITSSGEKLFMPTSRKKIKEDPRV